MCFVYFAKCKAWLLSEGILMMKYTTEFDVGDIIKYNHKHYTQICYYLVIAVSKIKYIVLSFEDNEMYDLAKCDYSYYEKVS